MWTVLIATCTTGSGRAVGVSRVALPMLSVQVQPVRPSREEQTCQTLVSGRRPCEPKHPSSRLTAPGRCVLAVRTIRASSTRDGGLLRACSTTCEYQTLCEKAVSNSAGVAAEPPRGAVQVVACICACERLTSGTAAIACARRPRMPSPALATPLVSGRRQTGAARRDGLRTRV